MPSLAIAMIVKNEEECLAACLHAVERIADSIVIGDTGSSDQTIAIAKQFNATVISIPWRDDFAWARNEVLNQVTSDWVLHLDADEIVDEANAARIRALVDMDGDGADAIEVTLANYCDDPRAWRWQCVPAADPHARGHAGYMRTELLRLFRHGLGFEYREPVHENITASVVERGGVIRRSEILIHHYGYRLPHEMPERKAKLYLTIARKKTVDSPNDAKAWLDFAEQSLACGNADDAEVACHRALALCRDDLAAGTTLANLLLNRGEIEEAKKLLIQLAGKHGDLPHLLTALAAIAMREGEDWRAEEFLNHVLEKSPQAIMAHYYLFRLLDLRGEIEAATNAIEKIVALAPGLPEFQRRLRAHRIRRNGEEVYAAGDYHTALQLLTESLTLDSDDPITHNDLGVVLLALEQKARAQSCFRAALKLAPGYTAARDNLELLADE